MKRPILPILLLASALGACATSGSDAARDPEARAALPISGGVYPLQWTPGHLPAIRSMNRSGLYQQRIKLVFVDARPEPRSVFAEDVHAGRQLHTSDDIAVWCSQHLVDTLAEYHLQFTASGESLVLQVELVSAKVLKVGKFNAEVALRVSATRPDGQLVWQGFVDSKASRVGRADNMGNYYQALSAAIRDAARDLLNDEGFVFSLAPAVQGYPAPPSPAVQVVAPPVQAQPLPPSAPAP